MRLVLSTFIVAAVGSTLVCATADGGTKTRYPVGAVAEDAFTLSDHPTDVLLALPSWCVEAPRLMLAHMIFDQHLYPYERVTGSSVHLRGDGAQPSLDVEVLKSGSPDGSGLVARVRVHPLAGQRKTRIYTLLRFPRSWKIIEYKET